MHLSIIYILGKKWGRKNGNRGILRLIILWHDAWKLQSAQLLGGASLSTFPWQHGRRRCRMENCWNKFPQQWIRLKKQCTSILFTVTSTPRQRIQKHFRSHGNEPPKHSNSAERNTLLLKEVISIWLDQNLPQGVKWPTEDKQKSEVKSLVHV
jgi:hypothetical protein